MTVVEKARQMGKHRLVRVLAAAGVAAMAGVMSSPIPADPIPAQQLLVTPPAKPAPPAAPTVTAARSEAERLRDVVEGIVPRRRGGWDGINRKAGDRAHKRLKARRRGGKR